MDGYQTQQNIPTTISSSEQGRDSISTLNIRLQDEKLDKLYLSMSVNSVKNKLTKVLIISSLFLVL